MNKTPIEWVRNPDGTQGYTWNPITGCLNGCSYCYARKLANGRLRHLMLQNTDVAITPQGASQSDPFWPRFWHKRFEDLFTMRRSKPGEPPFYSPAARKALRPRGIFVCDMGELFGPWLPSHWTAQVIAAASWNPQHRFYLLTKQWAELAKWSPFPENCWVGVSAWDAQSLVVACRYLRGIQATIKYISLEPLFSWNPTADIGGEMVDAGVTWLIVGAQTKPLVLPKEEWLTDIVHECRYERIRVFVKDSIEKNMGLARCQEFPVKVPEAAR